MGLEDLKYFQDYIEVLQEKRLMQLI